MGGEKKKRIRGEWNIPLPAGLIFALVRKPEKESQLTEKALSNRRVQRWLRDETVTPNLRWGSESESC